MARPTTGRVLAVCAAQRDVVLDSIGASGIDKRPLSGPVAVVETGLTLDHSCDTRHHGGVDQAVYAYDDAEAARWATDLGRDLPAGWFGENLRVSGLAVTDAVVGERWRVGRSVELEATIPRMPCRTFAVWAAEPRWVKRFLDRGDFGAYLRVCTPGEIQAGDEVTVVSRPDHGVRVRDLLAGTGDPDALRALLADPDLPAKVRREATKALKRATHGAPDKTSA
ncbi:MOSC domain-containing protein [Williamsia sterculiae]|uniref:MOSC domain-containing protein YiiM n=1 Tax=Williamsia sterculiae TaxID=1344003 RepID=A0A1N7GXE0_9NOCA|nr:MOSC domain-containing protein [Williamsia sterculiae]SIS17251.1 MOSC domain-containing protein YiiM [Williamsia sterculiae]